jgi:hypothetical protein
MMAKRIPVVIVALMAGLLVLGGCAGGGAPGAPEDSATSPTPSAPLSPEQYEPLSGEGVQFTTPPTPVAAVIDPGAKCGTGLITEATFKGLFGFGNLAADTVLMGTVVETRDEFYGETGYGSTSRTVRVRVDSQLKGSYPHEYFNFYQSGGYATVGEYVAVAEADEIERLGLDDDPDPDSYIFFKSWADLSWVGDQVVLFLQLRQGGNEFGPMASYAIAGEEKGLLTFDDTAGVYRRGKGYEFFESGEETTITREQLLKLAVR